MRDTLQNFATALVLLGAASGCSVVGAGVAVVDTAVSTGVSAGSAVVEGAADVIVGEEEDEDDE